MWFDELFGFPESAANVYAHLSPFDGQLFNKLSGETLNCGQLTTPALVELRSMVDLAQSTGKLSVIERIADVQVLHRDPANAGALFQLLLSLTY